MTPPPIPDFAPGAVEQPIATRFEAVVDHGPERPALRFRGAGLTYGELEAAANRIAHALLARLGPDPLPVGALLEPGPAMAAAMLGILKAGKIYVAPGLEWPDTRLRAVAADAGYALALYDHETRGLLERLALGVPALDLDALDPGGRADRPRLELDPGQPALIVYTSGSTGEPKGVAHSHRNVLEGVRVMTDTLQLTAADRVLQLFGFETLTAPTSIFRAVLNGGVACLYDLRRDGIGGLGRFMREAEVSVYYSVASVYRAWIESLAPGDKLPCLRLIQVGGEPMGRRDLEAYQRRFSRACRFMNSLGTTENFGLARFYMDHDTRLAGPLVPIGHPSPDKEVLLLDRDGRPVPDGEVGELAVKSRFNALGYWRRPDLTAAAFRPVPGEAGVTLYRTGDLARRVDGCLYLIGRADTRVKVRGQWVETSQVELALLEHPNVKEAAVLQETGEAAGELVGYVAYRRPPAPGARELRAFLLARLPEVMAPAAFVALPEFPHVPNGKVDRNALAAAGHPRLTWEATDGAAGRPPSPTEARLLALWRALLKVEHVALDDGFFALGGHSLLATELVARIERDFGVALPLALVFEAGTVAELASAIEALSWASAE
jgi:amino acid adenylation domain-containing protein